MRKKHEDRLLFLKQFTKELILQSKPSELAETSKPEQEIHVMIPQTNEIESITEKYKPSVMKIPRHRVKIKPVPTPAKLPRKTPSKPPLSKIQPSIMSQPYPSQTTQSQFQPKPQPVPKQEIDLGKLNLLLNDPRVTVIECPGPGKFILTRTAGRTEVTRISLNQEEIKSIINNFSEKSKIPVMPGLFKAAVGSLVISAVISDVAGSRFMISKMTPRFMMEQESQKY